MVQQVVRPPDAVLLRPVQLADAPALRQNCWPHRPPQQVTRLLQQAEYLARQERGLGAVAVLEEEVCGFGLLTLYPCAAEISDLIVSPSRRGQGIGTALIVHLTQEAQRLGVTTLEIGVAQSNPRARALYQRLGFVETRSVQIDLGEGPEMVLYLAKSLEAPPSHQLPALPR